MQSIEGTGAQQGETTSHTSTSPSCLPSSELTPSSDICMGRSLSRSRIGHWQSSPATSIPSREPSADVESKVHISSRSTTPEIELPTYLYGLDRKNPKVKAHKKSLKEQLRAIKLEMDGVRELDRHSEDGGSEDFVHSRAGKLEGRTAELVMQIEVMLREGLISPKDKVLRMASDCVPPETDCQSTAMDLRSLLSQMQSERPGTSCTGRVSFHSGTEAKSTTQRVGQPDATQDGSHLSQMPGAAIFYCGKKTAVKRQSEGGTSSQDSDVKVIQFRDTVC